MMSCSADLQALALPGAIQSWASGTDESVRIVCVYMYVCVWTNCLVVISLSLLLLIYLSGVPVPLSLHCFFTHVILHLLPLFLFL